MKIAKTSLKYLALVIVGICIAVVVVTVGASYVVIKELTQNQEPQHQDPNLNDLLKIGHNYSSEFAVFENLLGNIVQKPVPEFCSVLCKPSSFNGERLKLERTDYLVDFYRQLGRRSLEDPVFRLKLEEMSSLARLFPRSLREVLAQIEQIRQNQPQAPSQWALSIEFAVVMTKQIFSIANRMDSFKEEVQSFKEVRDLIQRCEQGAPHKEVLAHCQSLMRN
jgi:hypothetical protein